MEKEITTVKVIFHNVLADYQDDIARTREVYLQITSALTLEKAVGLADVSSYYPLSGVFTFNEQQVPYIVSEGKVRWDVPYSEVKVSDFLATHALENHTITAYEGYSMAGGPGFKELEEIWEQVYPLLEKFATVTGAVTAMKGAGKWLMDRFRKAKIPPQSGFDLIFSRTLWNHFELSELLDISPEDSKKILVSLGYRYDRSKMMYVQQSESLELKEKLAKVEVRDI